MIVIIYDTSAIVASNFLETDVKLIETIKKTSKEIKIILPEIVIDESLNKLKENIDDINKKLEETIKKTTHTPTFRFIEYIPSYNNKLNKLNILIDNNTKTETLKVLKKRFTEIAEIHPYPKTPIKEYVHFALERKDPFYSKEKNEFRDSVIWETIKEICSGLEYDDDNVIFISNNSNDFFDKKDKKTDETENKEQIMKLHSLLEKELNDIGFYNFFCYNALREYSKKYFTNTADFTELAMEDESTLGYIIKKKLLDIDIKEQLGKYINESLFSEDNKHDFEQFIEYTHDDTIDIDYIGFIDDEDYEIEVLEIKSINEEIVQAIIKCKIEYSISVYIYKSDYYAEDDEIGDVKDWNDHYFYKEECSECYGEFMINYNITESIIINVDYIDDSLE